MTELKDLYKVIDDSAKTYTDLMGSLVAIPSLSPDYGGVGEYDRVEFLEGYLRQRKTFDEIERVDFPDDRAKNGVRPNLMAHRKCRGANKTLWLISHSDTVPPGDLAQWSSNPYILSEDGGRLYGRGTEDGLQGICSTLAACEGVHSLGLNIDLNVSLMILADEETGNGYGLKKLMSERAGLFSPNDLVIVANGGNRRGDRIEVAEKSILWLRFRIEGRGCQASMPHLGVNSFRAGAHLIVSLEDLKRDFATENELFEPPYSTFEPTLQEYKPSGINAIPEENVFYYDCRILPSLSLKRVKERIAEICSSVEKEHSVKVSFEVENEVEATESTQPSADVVARAAEAIESVYRVRAQARGIGWVTPAALIRRAGVPAIVYSKIEETAHLPDEYCVLENLLGDAKVFATIMGRRGEG